MQFARGKPLLVVTWCRKNGERVPDESIELDPARLQRPSSNGTIYRYEGEVPRAFRIASVMLCRALS
jgi:hypothetical protein